MRKISSKVYTLQQKGSERLLKHYIQIRQCTSFLSLEQELLSILKVHIRIINYITIALLHQKLLVIMVRDINRESHNVFALMLPVTCT